MLCRKENAHDDSIWGCVWGQIKKKKDKEEDKEDSHDGELDIVDYIATGAVDDCVKLWSYENKKLKLNHKLEGHALGVVSVAINSDGTSKLSLFISVINLNQMQFNQLNLLFLECASSSMDSSLFMWDVISGEKIGNIDVGPVEIWTIAFSPDDKFIISGSHSGKISMYGVESRKQEQTLDTRGKFTLSIAYVSTNNYANVM